MGKGKKRAEQAREKRERLELEKKAGHQSKYQRRRGRPGATGPVEHS